MAAVAICAGVYLPADCKDDNMADAAGIHDWVSAVHGRAAQPFHLFDDGRLRHGYAAAMAIIRRIARAS